MERCLKMNIFKVIHSNHDREDEDLWFEQKSETYQEAAIEYGMDTEEAGNEIDEEFLVIVRNEKTKEEKKFMVQHVWEAYQIGFS